MRVPSLLLGLLCAPGCGSGPLEPNVGRPQVEPGFTARVETKFRTLEAPRITLAIDGELVEGSSAHYAHVPPGIHTVQVRLDADLPCGLFDNERGHLILRDSQSYDVRGNALVEVRMFERSVTHPPKTLVATQWSFAGDRAIGAEGCNFGPEVTFEGCNTPADYPVTTATLLP